jgi:hypothetical protein
MPLLNKQLEPFDPAKHKPQDVGLGGPSTEYISTVDSPEGGVMNIPTIWWDAKGKPTLFDPKNKTQLKKAIQLSIEYEKETGKQFPRYGAGAYQEATDAAILRSNAGGATQGPLAKKPDNSLLP